MYYSIHSVDRQYLLYFLGKLFDIFIDTLNAEPLCVEHTARLDQCKV